MLDPVLVLAFYFLLVLAFYLLLILAFYLLLVLAFYFLLVLAFYLLLVLDFYFLLVLEIGIAVSAQSSCIILFVTVDAFVSKHFATIQTMTILAHAFGKMLTVLMWAVLVDHYCW